MPKHPISIAYITTSTYTGPDLSFILEKKKKVFQFFQYFAPAFLRRLPITSPQHLFYFKRIKMHQSLTHSWHFQGYPITLFIRIHLSPLSFLVVFISYHQWQGQRPAGCVVFKNHFILSVLWWNLPANGGLRGCLGTCHRSVNFKLILGTGSTWLSSSKVAFGNCRSPSTLLSSKHHSRGLTTCLGKLSASRNLKTSRRHLHSLGSVCLSWHKKETPSGDAQEGTEKVQQHSLHPHLPTSKIPSFISWSSIWQQILQIRLRVLVKISRASMGLWGAPWLLTPSQKQLCSACFKRGKQTN